MVKAAFGDTITYTKGAAGAADTIANLVVIANSDGSDPAIGYPSGAAAVVASSGNVTNASAVATIPAVAAKTNYLAGFEVSGSGATAGLPVIVTVVGLLGGTASYIYTFEAGVLVGNKPLTVQFAPPLPASAVNTAIVVTCPASGAGGTNNAVVAHGFNK